MTLTIKNKLIIIGILAITALSVSSIISILSNRTLQELNDQARVVDSNKTMSERMIAARQTLIRSLYSEVIDRGNITPDETAIYIKAVETMDDMLDRIVKKNATYITPGNIKEAKKLSGEMSQIIKVELPELLKRKAPEEEFKKIKASMEEKEAKLAKIQSAVDDTIGENLSDLGDQVSAAINRTTMRLIAVFIIGLAILIPFLTVVILTIVRPLKKMSSTIEDLATGDYTTEITGDNKKDEIGTIARAAKELRKSVEKSTTLQTMVNSLSLPVMIADKNYNITYVNEASLIALRKLEKVLPIKADAIVGSNIDIFHKNQSPCLQV